MQKFQLKSKFRPAGDQPKAIKALVEGFKRGERYQTLLGVTGSGKTFTAANVIAQIQRPTLVIAHNKTLAAQLAQEYKEFFPDNAVHYFVSYYDYYQPEAYLPITDTYIEKEAQINEEIDRLRHATTQALLSRRDVIVVASVSCMYGLGSPEEYEKVNIKLQKGQRVSRGDVLRALIGIHYIRTNADLSPGECRALGNVVEVMPQSEREMYRIEISDELVQRIQKIDPITRKLLEEIDALFIFPAKHFITPEEDRARAIETIKSELKNQLKKFEKEGKLLEAERLKRRTNYDLAMIREVGYCNGIENYSRHFSGKLPGEPPDTLLSYFSASPRFDLKSGERSNLGDSADFLTIIDESHVTIPQLRGMYAGDKSRKDTLVEHGFRLPSARDNRPLQFHEFEERVGQVIFTSATPGPYEFEKSGTAVVEQVIRPTGLVDPQVEIRPVSENFYSSFPKGGAPNLRGTEDFKIPPPMSHRSAPFKKGRRDRQGYCGQIQDFKKSTRSDLVKKEGYKTGSFTRLQGRTLYGGQVKDFIAEAEKDIKAGGRVIATTLTKKMAEDLAAFLKEKGIKTEYLHSDILTLERIMILTRFRKGEFDCLVGVNLLREGLDLPEVSLIGILDADREGFLRSQTSLIQIIGRAARNVAGRVILYADVITGSIEKAIGETNRRRALQLAHNKKHGITPKTIIKKVRDIIEAFCLEHEKAVSHLMEIDKEALKNKTLNQLLKEKKVQMNAAVKILDFETAALLRDEIRELEKLTLHPLIMYR